MNAPSPPVLDFERLLSPIVGDKPCGESLRWEPVWDELSQLRRSRKDPLDPSADKSPEWGQVVSRSTDVLTSQTKDLLVAGWLTEALVREKGFAGLRDGLRLIREFSERFWNDLHPLPDGEDLTNRAGPLVWLTSHDGGARMPAAIREIGLTSSGTPPLSWNDWHLRRAAPQGKDEKEDAYKKRADEAERRRLAFDSAVDVTPITFYQTLVGDIDAVTAEITALSSVLDERLKDHAPNWSELRKSMDEIRVFVHDVLRRRGGLTEAARPQEAAAPAGEAKMSSNGDGGTSANHSGPIRSRVEAIARLSEAAQYFSDSEPHSPVAYLVRRAIRWADMGFADVLSELVKDDKLVKQIGETLGIQSGPPGKSS